MTDWVELVRFVVTPEEWMERARCRELHIPTASFFPVRGQSQKLAKQTCMACPVKAECEEYAIRSGSQWGIWAGKIRKRRRDVDNDSDSLPTNPIIDDWVVALRERQRKQDLEPDEEELEFPFDDPQDAFGF